MGTRELQLHSYVCASWMWVRMHGRGCVVCLLRTRTLCWRHEVVHEEWMTSVQWGRATMQVQCSAVPTIQSKSGRIAARVNRLV